MSELPSSRRKPDSAHARYRELLERHLDGELSPEEKMDLFDHLEDCEECQGILEAEQRLVARLSELPRLVTPSSLRANILHNVEREKQERSQPLQEDERFARIFDDPDFAEEQQEELPIFASVTPPARPAASRRRRQRLSQAAAFVFLSVAVTAFLLTGDFSQFPLLNTIQQTALSLISGQSTTTAETTLPRSPALAAPRIATAGLRAGADGLQQLSTRPAIYVRDWVACLAVAAARVPGPAESSKPTLAAIVLKPTDADGTSSWGGSDDLDSTIRETAEVRLQGKLASQDRFIFAGHRYRCYVYRLPGERLEHLVRSLSQFRAAAEQPILNAINEQTNSAAKLDRVAFFTAQRRQFKNAVRAFPHPATNAASAAAREVRIVIVD